MTWDIVSLMRRPQNRAHLLAAKHKQIRVLRDDPIDDTFSLEVTQLSVGFVRRNDVVDGFDAQCLTWSVFDRRHLKVVTPDDERLTLINWNASSGVTSRHFV